MTIHPIYRKIKSNQSINDEERDWLAKKMLQLHTESQHYGWEFRISRTFLKLTQKEYANKIGIKTSSVQYYEREKRKNKKLPKYHSIQVLKLINLKFNEDFSGRTSPTNVAAGAAVGAALVGVAAVASPFGLLGASIGGIISFIINSKVEKTGKLEKSDFEEISDKVDDLKNVIFD